MTNDDFTPSPVIVCAAVKSKNGTIICGARHHHCFKTMKSLGIQPSFNPDDQGFVDQFNHFHSREESLKIQQHNHPDWIKMTDPDHELFSEDLY